MGLGKTAIATGLLDERIVNYFYFTVFSGVRFLFPAGKLLLLYVEVVSVEVDWWVSICHRNSRSSPKTKSSIVILIENLEGLFIDVWAFT